MRFTPLHRRHFQCDDGAYSEVTSREVFDSQITLTDTEVEIVVGFFGGDIHRGNVGANRDAASKEFWNFNRNEPCYLNLVYPKPERDELRLYLSVQAGFKPAADEIWFLFVRDGRLNIGAYSESQWRTIGRTDAEDDAYQTEIIQSIFTPKPPKYVEVPSSIVQVRDPRLALERFEVAGFRCEFDRACRLFTSRATGRNFLECHHIIPMQFQADFGPSLDFLDNLIALCPYCHRAIHHAEVDLTRTILETILQPRDALLGSLDLSPKRVFELYNCEEITE